MTSIVSVSPTDLKTRRQRLKRRRQLKLLQAMWRSLLVSGMAGGLFWALSQPNWIVRQPEQIDVEGNQFLSAQAIRSLLPLSYPQSIWQLKPQLLSQQLKSAAPIAEARVTRQLLPPGLMVEVEERKPVAVAVPPALSSNIRSQTNEGEIGFVDEQGVWMPQSSYAAFEEGVELPTLRAIGLKPQLSSQWSAIYRATQESSLNISEIDLRNPSNLVLKTELGIVRCGPYAPHFQEQLKVLSRMRELPNRVPPSHIAYIDLTNPQSPAVQLRSTFSQTP